MQPSWIAASERSPGKGAPTHSFAIFILMDTSVIRKGNLMLLYQQDLDGIDAIPRDTITLQFVEKIGMTIEQFTELQSGLQEFDEALARSIEQRLSLPSGWLDQENAAYPGDEDTEHLVQHLQELHRSAPTVAREAVNDKIDDRVAPELAARAKHPDGSAAPDG